MDRPADFADLLGWTIWWLVGFACGAGWMQNRMETRAIEHNCAAYHLEGKTAVFKWNDEVPK